MARTVRKPASRRSPSRRASRRASSNGPSIAASIAGVSIGAIALAGAAALIGIFARRRDWMGADWLGDAGADNAEHAAPDLALDAPRPGTGDRAPEAFRPDPTAPVPASEREGLRPATGPAPSMVGG